MISRPNKVWFTAENVRRGFSLIEVVAAMSVVTAILSATVVLMHFVLQMGSEARQQTHAVATVGRLAGQFRRDAHQARGQPVVAANHRAAEFHLPGGRVVAWRVDQPGGVTRTEQAAAAPSREDSFALPKGTVAEFELQSQRAARIVSLRIDSSAAGGPSLAIDAVASRDERLAVEEEKP